MDLFTFMTFVILMITILTLVFGVLAYFLYKVRESKRKVQVVDEGYEEIVQKNEREFLFLKKVDSHGGAKNI